MNCRDSEEKERFLPYYGDKREACNCHHRRTLLLHILFFVIYACTTGVLFKVGSQMFRKEDNLTTWTLLGEQLAIRPERFALAENSAFAGPPSTDIDMAWRKLLDHVNIRASSDELALANQTSIELPHNRGSLVWMDVSHQLHCVKYLRQWIYRQHYHPDVGPDEEPHWLLHTDHCLDLVRQALMCRADTSLMTFEWAAGRREPMLKLQSPEHVCVDWNDLMERVQARRISDAEMALLVNPGLESETDNVRA
ncbi:hypothetical protein T440DRAFT_434131 [Plenodomus tracheiphilus IPT5]|uniref:Tat pathway signal sequence n=1 Tax=Plenodomus tracheiphilus IPT5 TaxID=1408161 RepID=A0A6A7ARR6_9PLEO|nr:hypothetical protein T440DRAFT_434131 [Plenodomus tracheiphilus IPT5]